MSERYKVLGAILTLGEFNVEELANFSDVKKNTVSTVIGRVSDFIEEIGLQKSGGRGGSYKRYRIKPDRVSKLRSEIDKLFPEYLKSLTSIPLTEEIKPPLSLLSAEDILKRIYPEAKDEEKHDLLNLASSNLREAEGDMQVMIDRNADHPTVKVIKDNILLLSHTVEVRQLERTVKERERTVKERELTVKERELTVKERERTVKERERTVKERERTVKERERTVKGRGRAVPFAQRVAEYGLKRAKQNAPKIQLKYVKPSVGR